MIVRGQAGVALLAAVLAAQGIGRGDDPRIRLVSPGEGTPAAGPVVLRAVIDPPGSIDAVTSVSFFVDGRRVCQNEPPRLACEWDLGTTFEARVIRVVATLTDGRRVADSIRTRKFVVAERVDVELVQVTASVTDSDGTFVKGLTNDAFRLFEDQVPQAITYFAAEHAALEVLVAIDVSASMKAAMPSVRAAVKQFLAALRPGDDVSVLAFNESVYALARRQPDPAARVRAVDRLQAWGGTALYDVVIRGLEMLGRRQGRRAMVVFTDGEDQSSLATLDSVVASVESSDATLYAIGQGRATRSEHLAALLQRLATISGGRAFLTDDPNELDAVFARIVEELSSQYLLAYTSTNPRRDGSWRQIRVEVPGRQSLRVRARQGYRARHEG